MWGVGDCGGSSVVLWDNNHPNIRHKLLRLFEGAFAAEYVDQLQALPALPSPRTSVSGGKRSRAQSSVDTEMLPPSALAKHSEKGASSSSSSASTAKPLARPMRSMLLDTRTQPINRFAVKELTVSRQFPHPNIIPIRDAWFPSSPSRIRDYLVLTMPHGGISLLQLSALMTRNPPTAQQFNITVLSIVMDAAQALAHLHHHNIIHGDVKPENLVYANGRTILIDLGTATVNPTVRQSHESACTYLYESPETLATASKPYFHAMNDVWSVGLIIFTLILGAHPYWIALDDPLRPDVKIHHNEERYRPALLSFLNRVRDASGGFLSFERMFGSRPEYESAMERYRQLCPVLKDLLERMLLFAPRDRPSMARISEICRDALAEVYQCQRVLHPPQPRMELNTPISLEYISRLKMLPTCRPEALKQVWEHIMMRETEGRSDATNGMHAFVLAVHIWDRYCCLRQKRFRHFQQYLGFLFLSLQLAYSLLFFEYRRIDFSTCYTPKLVNRQSSLEGGSVVPAVLHPQDANGNRVCMGQFLAEMREDLMDILQQSGGLLWESTFFDSRTMNNPRALYSIVSADDYYTKDHEYLRLRYNKYLHNFGMVAWYPSVREQLSAPISLSSNFGPAPEARPSLPNTPSVIQSPPPSDKRHGSGDPSRSASPASLMTQLQFTPGPAASPSAGASPGGPFHLSWPAAASTTTTTSKSRSM